MFSIIFAPEEFYLELQQKHLKIPIIDLIRNKIKELRSIDLIIKTLIDEEHTITSENFQIIYLINHNLLKSFKLGKYTWTLSDEDIKKVLNGTSILFLTERKIFIPIKKVSKMMKGIIEERGINIKIEKNGFYDGLNNDEDDKIKIEVISRNDERFNILADECNGKLLIFYLNV
ncbi:MAG: hypothetical protein ACTSQO_08055 [Candidatus Helarchaeota archaeon]